MKPHFMFNKRERVTPQMLLYQKCYMSNEIRSYQIPAIHLDDESANIMSAILHYCLDSARKNEMFLALINN